MLDGVRFSSPRTEPTLSSKKCVPFFEKHEFSSSGSGPLWVDSNTQHGFCRLLGVSSRHCTMR
jgi:hypothetical protein